MNLKQLSLQVSNLCVSNGDLIKKELGHLKAEDIHNKGVHDFVTYVDKISEKRIVKELSRILPEASFIVEENTISNLEKQLVWVVDPLDGTTNFIHGIPCFSISIALMRDKEVIMGVVYDIMREECFYSWGEGKSWLNDKEIKVSINKTIEDSVIGTGFPSRDYSRIDDYMRILKILFDRAHGVRRFGSAAIDLCYVACGRFDIFFEYGLSPWDIAAGSFIVSQAGGKVSDYSGNSDYIFGKDIVASNELLHNEILSLLNG